MTGTTPQRLDLIADGLLFPEGPIALPDRSVVLVELLRGTLTRAWGGGRTEVVCDLGGGPNGAALGPDSERAMNKANPAPSEAPRPMIRRTVDERSIDMCLLPFATKRIYSQGNRCLIKRSCTGPVIRTPRLQ